MKKTSAMGLIGLFLLGAALQAQEAPQPRLWVVYTEVVKPSRVMEYEGMTKEMTGTMKASKVESPLVNFTGIALDGFEYVYVIPITKMADLDSMYVDWMKAQEKIGKSRWMDMARRAGNNIEYFSQSLVMERPDLSYAPANRRLKEEEAPFVNYSFYYIIPGREQEAEQLAKDYVALFRKKNITEPFTVYQAIFGEEIPLFVVGSPAKSLADYVDQNEKVNRALGSEGQALGARAMAITRRFEERHGQLRPDLSYPPPAPATASK